MPAKTFPCDACGGRAIEVTGPDRTFEYRPGIRLAVPADFPLWTCEQCGEISLTTRESVGLERALAPAYWEYFTTLVEDVCRAASVNQRELGVAMGLGAIHFIRAQSGSAKPDLPTIRFLQVLARYPEEIQRLLSVCESSR